MLNRVEVGWGAGVLAPDPGLRPSGPQADCAWPRALKILQLASLPLALPLPLLSNPLWLPSTCPSPASNGEGPQQLSPSPLLRPRLDSFCPKS